MITTFLWDKNSFSSPALGCCKTKSTAMGGQNGYLLDRDRILFTGMFRVGFVDGSMVIGSVGYFT